MTEPRDSTDQIAHGVCLAPEILAAYLDHRLTDAERSEVERHVAVCDDCRELLVEAFRASAALDEQGVAAVEAAGVENAALESAVGESPPFLVAGAKPGGLASSRREAADAGDAAAAGTGTGPRPVSASVSEPVSGMRLPDEGAAFAAREAAAARPSSPAEDRRWRRRVWMSTGGLLAAAAAFILIVRVDPAWYQRLRGVPPGVSPLHAALVEAVGERRQFEARLTGGFAYGPVPSVTRSASDPSRRLPPDVRIAVLHIEEAAQQDTSPALRHAAAVAKLMSGDTDGAIALLDELARAETVQPRVLTDLSAAYLTRARDRGDPADLPRAIDAARRAVTADASLAEAWFNLALAREAGNERAPAREAWTRYLTVDKTSPWRAEAERHLAALPPP